MLLDPTSLPTYLRHARPGTLLGHPLRYLAETGSTSDEALAWAAQGAPEGATVLAARQSRGRGRKGRSWLSEAGAGLWFSLVLRPGLGYPAAGMLPLAVGFGVALALRAMGLPAAVKWPNDVLVREKKICGVLVDGRTENGNLALAVVGIGVNWLCPGALALTGLSTGLAAEFAALEAAAPPSPEGVLAAILDHIERAYLLLRAAGPAPFVAAWPRLSAHFGRPAVVVWHRGLPPAGRGERVEVLTRPILPDGRLEVILPGGQRELLSSDEVSLGLA